MMQAITTVLAKTAQKLTAYGLRTEHSVIPRFGGYQAVTGKTQTDVYCLECQLGPAHNNPEYTAYAVAQVFDPVYPSLALITMVERRNKDGMLNSTPPVYNRQIDQAFSYTFLPTMHTAFNELDPTGQERGLLVQSYNARITPADLVPASLATVTLLKRFKQDGQLAQIAVDFEDPLTAMIARLVKPLASNRDVHYLPRSKSASAIMIPLSDSKGGYQVVGNNSTALDKGFAIAYDYLNRHYLAYQVTGLQQAVY